MTEQLPPEFGTDNIGDGIDLEGMADAITITKLRRELAFAEANMENFRTAGIADKLRADAAEKQLADRGAQIAGLTEALLNVLAQVAFYHGFGVPEEVERQFENTDMSLKDAFDAGCVALT